MTVLQLVIDELFVCMNCTMLPLSDVRSRLSRRRESISKFYEIVRVYK